MRNFAFFDMAAGLHNFEPADLTKGAGGPADSVLDRVLDAFLRGACNFNDPVDMIGHRRPPSGSLTDAVADAQRRDYFGIGQTKLKGAASPLRNRLVLDRPEQDRDG